MARQTKRKRSPMEIAADRLTKLALKPGTSPRRMVQATQDTIAVWEAQPDRVAMTKTLRAMLRIALIEAQAQTLNADEAQHGLARNVVMGLTAAIGVLNGRV